MISYKKIENPQLTVSSVTQSNSEENFDRNIGILKCIIEAAFFVDVSVLHSEHEMRVTWMVVSILEIFWPFSTWWPGMMTR